MIERKVWALVARYSGEETDVKLFNLREDAIVCCVDYFEDGVYGCAEEKMREFNQQLDEGSFDIDVFEEFLFAQDIGYFSISLHVIY